jgi:hypothetical protein
MWPWGASSQPKTVRGANHRNALGVGRHDDHGLLFVAACVGIGLAHDDIDRATRVARAGRPPLAAVDHVFVAIAFDPAADIGRIRRSHFRLGHQESRAEFTLEQRLEPLVFQRFARIALQCFHVPGIGSRAVEDFGGKRDTSHDLAQGRVFQIGQAFRGSRRFWEEEIPEAGGACLGFQLLDDGGRHPWIALRTVFCDFAEEACFVGVNVFVHELQQAGLHVLDFGAVVELHCDLLWRIKKCQALWANFHASSAMGRAPSPDLMAWALEAVPASTRLAMP